MEFLIRFLLLFGISMFPTYHSISYKNRHRIIHNEQNTFHHEHPNQLFVHWNHPANLLPTTTTTTTTTNIHSSTTDNTTHTNPHNLDPQHRRKQKGIPSEPSHMEEMSITLPSPRSDLTTALSIVPNEEGDIVEGIYLFGGCDHYNEEEGEEECIAVTDNAWSFVPSEQLFIHRKRMPIPRYRHISITVNGNSIWILTGRDSQQELIGQIDVYNPVLNSWITLEAELPSNLQLSDGAAFVRGSDLYVVGGYNDRYQASGLMYVIHTEASMESQELVYSVLEPMNTPRGDITALLFGRYAYVVGGFTHLNGFCTPLKTTEAYDIVNNKWSYMPDLNMARGDTSLVLFNGRIFALGGETTHLDPTAAPCQTKTASNNKNTNYKNKLIAKTYPVNSIEIIIPSPQNDQPWEMAYSDFLPPDNSVFRSVANAFPDQNVIYTFGGVSYDHDEGTTSEHEQEILRTSDKITIYMDDFKHGRFQGKSFGQLNNNGDGRNYWKMFFYKSSFLMIVLGAVVLLGVFFFILAKKYKERRMERTNFRFHVGNDAMQLVEISASENNPFAFSETV